MDPSIPLEGLEGEDFQGRGEEGLNNCGGYTVLPLQKSS